MPSIRIYSSSLDELDEMDLDDVDLFDGDSRRQRIDPTMNMEARARNAELQAQRRNDRRKNAVRGARRNSARR
jgi:hypothetical protein